MLTFIKEDVAFESHKCWNCQTGNVEYCSIRYRLSKKKWINVTNIYIPPNREFNTEKLLVLDNLSSGVDCFYGGDVHAHSHLWDLHQTQDSRGDRIEEWMADNDLLCANDGTRTSINRGTTGESSPDTFLVHTRWRSRAEWTVGECLGSDHLPMVITLRCEVGLFPQAPKPARWKTKNVNWNAFNETLESEVALWENLPTVRASAKIFTEALTEVGKAHVGKTKPGKRKKVGLSPSAPSCEEEEQPSEARPQPSQRMGCSLW